MNENKFSELDSNNISFENVTTGNESVSDLLSLNIITSGIKASGNPDTNKYICGNISFTNKVLLLF